MKTISIMVFLIFLYPVAVNSADVSISRDSSFWEPMGLIEGPIVRGDYEKIVETAKNIILKSGASGLVFEIDSRGGDVSEAIKIGRLFRDLLVDVNIYGNIIRSENQYIEDELKKTPDSVYQYRYDKTIKASESLKSDDLRACYSACVLIYLGAVNRGIRDNHDQRLGREREVVIPIVGLHRPYFEKGSFGRLTPAEASKQYAKLSESVSQYISEMGGDGTLMSRMLKKSSNEVELVKKDDFLSHVNSTEPFLEEWLIAKCGEQGEKGALSASEYPRYDNLIKLQKAEAKQRFSDDLRQLRNNEIDISSFRNKVDEFYLAYAPIGYTKDEVEYLHRLVNTYSEKTRQCRESAIHLHQYGWASR